MKSKALIFTLKANKVGDIVIITQLLFFKFEMPDVML